MGLLLKQEEALQINDGFSLPQQQYNRFKR